MTFEFVTARCSTARNLLGLALAVAGIVCSIGVEAQTGPLKIGAVLCSSGPFANIGIDEMRGAQLAEEAINAAGGVNGRKIQILFEDDQGKVDLSVLRANKLVEQEKVSAMIACYGAGAVAYSEMLKKAEVPLFAMIGSAALTQTNNPYVFRTFLGDPTVVEGLTDVLRKNGRKRVALLYQNDTYGRGATYVTRDAKAKGFEIVADEAFPIQGSVDLTPNLTRVRAANPDALVIWAGTTLDILAMKNMQQLGLKVQVYGGPTMASPTVLAVDAAEGAIVPDAINRSMPSPEQARFTDDFQKKFGSKPSTSFAMSSYDSVSIIAEAAKGTNGSGAAIKANAEKISVFKGLLGRYVFTADKKEGLTVDSIKWHVMKGGQFTPMP
jgi:branched-chain amino acid transport system substrate-binding protein